MLTTKRDAVLKQKEELKIALNEIKQLKKQSFKNLVPTLLEKTQTINGIAYLYESIDGASNEELKEIAQQLGAKKPGLYFLISTADQKGIFVAYLSPSITSVDLKTIATQLKDKYGIRGGGSGNFLQGGASQFDASLKDDLKNWIK